MEERLKRIQRRFLWGGGLEQKRIAWIKWDQDQLKSSLETKIKKLKKLSN